MKLGFTPIDEDHEGLLLLAKEVEVLIACECSVRAKFHELVEYSLAHFSREEAHMEACRYPGLDVHRSEHQELAGWLLHIDESLDPDGPNASPGAADQALAFFQAWIERHLMVLDKPAIRFILSASCVSQPEPPLPTTILREGLWRWQGSLCVPWGRPSPGPRPAASSQLAYRAHRRAGCSRLPECRR
jgi:hemerythrin